KIFCADREQPSPKGKAPPRPLLGEAKLTEQGLDGDLLTGDEADAPAPQAERRRQLDLVRDVVDHIPERGNALERVAVGIAGARRVADDTIATGEPPQVRRAPVVGLGKAALHPRTDVVARDGINPVARHRLTAEDRLRQALPERRAPGPEAAGQPS